MLIACARRFAGLTLLRLSEVGRCRVSLTRSTLAEELRVCLSAQQFQQIFQALRGEFDVAADAEITLECAPGQLSDETLAELLRQGMNRISFGVQSFVDQARQLPSDACTRRNNARKR